MLLVLAAYLTVGAGVALMTGTQPESSIARLVLLLGGLVMLPPLALAKYRVARALPSPALRLDGILTAVAAVLAAIGLLALALDELAHVPWADAVGALIVAAIVSREGWTALLARSN